MMGCSVVAAVIWGEGGALVLLPVSRMEPQAHVVTIEKLWSRDPANATGGRFRAPDGGKPGWDAGRIRWQAASGERQQVCACASTFARP